MTRASGTLFIEQIDALDLGLWTDDGPQGSTFEVDLEISAPLDEVGFVCDFSTTKQTLKKALKTTLDHRFIAPTKHPDYQLTLQNGQATWRPKDPHSQGLYFFKGPASSVYGLPTSHITLPELEQEVHRIACKAFSHLPYTDLKIFLRSENIRSKDGTYLHYTHGISHHNGLCHRMWHGHRSRVVVLRNSDRSPALEDHLTRKLGSNPFHLAEPNQIIGKTWQPGTLGPKNQLCELGYDTIAGPYRAIMPASKVWLAPKHTSVETFSTALARELKTQDPEARIQVRLYEGANKGGICELP